MPSSFCNPSTSTSTLSLLSSQSPQSSPLLFLVFVFFHLSFYFVSALLLLLLSLHLHAAPIAQMVCHQQICPKINPLWRKVTQCGAKTHTPLPLFCQNDKVKTHSAPLPLNHIPPVNFCAYNFLTFAERNGFYSLL